MKKYNETKMIDLWGVIVLPAAAGFLQKLQWALRHRHGLSGTSYLPGLPETTMAIAFIHSRPRR